MPRKHLISVHFLPIVEFLRLLLSVLFFWPRKACGLGMEPMPTAVKGGAITPRPPGNSISYCFQALILVKPWLISPRQTLERTLNNLEFKTICILCCIMENIFILGIRISVACLSCCSLNTSWFVSPKILFHLKKCKPKENAVISLFVLQARLCHRWLMKMIKSLSISLHIVLLSLFI